MLEVPICNHLCQYYQNNALIHSEESVVDILRDPWNLIGAELSILRVQIWAWQFLTTTRELGMLVQEFKASLTVELLEA